MGKRKTFFSESAKFNNATYYQYRDRLMDICMSMWEWTGLPESINSRTLEYTLMMNGRALLFTDEVMGYLALPFTPRGGFDVDGVPVLRRAYSRYNNYQQLCDRSNSVVIYNNQIRCNSVLDIEMFARRLYNMDRTIDVNMNAQKTPILIQGTEEEKLSLVNLYKEYDGNAPVIFGYKGMNPKGITSISTQAPFVSDKIYEIKTNYWNECLTYLGISNVNIMKRERMTQEEVTRNLGGAVASRKPKLKARQEACEKFNKLFGTDIWCEYDENFIAPGLPEPENVSRETLYDGGDTDE